MTKVELQFYETVIRELPKITKALQIMAYESEKQDQDKILTEQYNRNREFKNQIK
tara:strand:+ start:12705 stop:12869 length:165 start_codon:yes stop_codon:yes gene_type:complete